MPINTVPNAPNPVHIAYAVPIGKLWAAFAKNPMLRIEDIKNAATHHQNAEPSAFLVFPKLKVINTSKTEATNKIIQFITKRFI